MSSKQIIEMAVSDLRPYHRNARTHSKKQIKLIAASLERFGFTNPVLVDGSGQIIAGHGRVEAAKLLDLKTVPCLRIDHLTPTEQRAYVIADNKLALNAGWDEELLGLELKELAAENLDLDIELTGFSISEIDSLIEGLSPQETGDPAEEALPPLNDCPVRMKTGDIYKLGPHRLVCGDSCDPAVVTALMGGELAEMVFTDPPY